MHWLVLFLLCISCSFLQAQDKQNAKLKPIAVVPYQGGAIDYATHVEPILDNKCTTCHSGANKKGRLDLSSYEALQKGGKNGPAIVPGRPDESLLIKLSGHTQKPVMPPVDEEPLTPQELALLKAWIQQGGKGSGTTTPRPTASIKLLKMSERIKPVVAMALTADKKVLAVGRGPIISLYNVDKGDLLKQLIDPDLKDEKNQPLKQSQMDLVQALVFSADGEKLYSGGYKEVIEWNTKTGAILRKLTGFSDRVVALDLSPDGKFLATAGGAPTADGEVIIFDLQKGTPALTLTTPHSDTVFGIRYSPDGKMLASAGADKFVKVWAVQPVLRPESVAHATGAAVTMLTPWTSPAAAASADFETLHYLQSIDLSLVSPGKQLRSFEGHTHHVLDVAWRADGNVLVSAGADNVLKVWDYGKGEQIRTIGGHSKQISRLSVLKTAPMVISACGDAGLRQWNIDNGGNVRNYPGASDFLQAIATSPDGSLIAAGGEEGIVRIYNGQNGALLKTLAK